MNRDLYVSVSELNKYIKAKIKNDEALMNVFIRGEISNFKDHFRGHYYFSIKDEGSKVDAVMFATKNKNLKFKPCDGMKVLVAGYVDVYEVTGSYQIYVEFMEEDGLGNLYVKFEQLKERLAKEGLFDQAHKRTIPKLPTRIGIVTAPTGAAIRDIISTIERRNPVVQTILFPTLVQGDEAAESIARQIGVAQNYDIDVIIIGRGGGSIEDLWAFNEEIVARAIYNSRIPVISAVGHEIDFTISDFVADLRAPTPTGAAEIAVVNVSDLLRNVGQINTRLIICVKNIINSHNIKLKALTNSRVLLKPMEMYALKQQKLDNLLERLWIVFSNYNDTKAKNLDSLIDKLNTLSPLNSLKRGYSFTTTVGGRLVKLIEDVKIGEQIAVQVMDGKIIATVLGWDKINKEEER
ncbi:MAG: exodeoxyribonuclease VII large subunit [Clostridiales bacterium GWE2_32_10]|nr:MAG: exodeoxyribonuclease VII large subunit [Clostridiales bacterium GWE2_32_10]HBY20476.1 exodeoxyribonuclease VII large subunit [Clostridiales bacterium]